MNAAGLTEDKLFLSACELCDISELQLVVNAGADIFETDKYYGMNGLYLAVKKNRPYEIIKYLVDMGLDVNAVCDPYRNTNRGGNINSVTSVLDVAEEQNNCQVIEYLKSKGSSNASELFGH